LNSIRGYPNYIETIRLIQNSITTMQTFKESAQIKKLNELDASIIK